MCWEFDGTLSETHLDHSIWITALDLQKSVQADAMKQTNKRDQKDTDEQMKKDFKFTQARVHDVPG